MKILHVFDHSLPLHSGYTFRSRAILEQQHAAGWATIQLTSSKQGACPGLEEFVDGLTFYRTPALQSWVSGVPVLKQWDVVCGLERRLTEVVVAERPDVIHAHSPALNGLAAVRVGRQLNVPVVYECRAFWEDAAADLGTGRAWGVRYRLSRHLETHVFRSADWVTCICDGLRRDILARGIAEDRVTVVPNAVNVEQFTAAGEPDHELAATVGVKLGAVLGFIGSFYDYEGLDVLVEAMPDILGSCSDACLLLVGGGPREAALQEKVAAMGLSDHVIFAGRVPHAEVARYYGLVDVLVYPRKRMRLTDLVTPLKPLEAMAQGKLVMASDVGGHREVIEDGVTGRLFRSDDPKALAQAALKLLGERDEWPVWRRRAREWVERSRTWRGSVERYRDIYFSLAPASEGPSKAGLEPRRDA